MKKGVFEKLSNGSFYSQSELSEILVTAQQNNALNLKKLAKKHNRAIEYKCWINNGRHGLLLRLSKNAPYQEKRICCDDIFESTITAVEFVAMSGNLGNRQYDLAECLFDNANKYLSLDALEKLTGLSACGIPGLVKNLVAAGFNIHTRGYKEDREFKLIGINKPRSKAKAKEVKRGTIPQSLNKVFR